MKVENSYKEVFPFYEQAISFGNQRAASSVVFSDLCNLNHTDYLYVFSYIGLFLYTIIHLTQRLR
jgi:hypothetical protein